MDRKIILDCDGVLLDWAYAFDVWMCEQGYQRLKNTDLNLFNLILTMRLLIKLRKSKIVII